MALFFLFGVGVQQREMQCNMSANIALRSNANCARKDKS